jgi:hypothetical protein
VAKSPEGWWPSAVSPVNLICTPRSPVLSVSACSARKDDLPEIWRQLIEAGFETGHAYAKALRMAMREQHLVPLMAWAIASASASSWKIATKAFAPAQNEVWRFRLYP